MFNATIFEIFIASPSDVKVERESISNVIFKWNSINGKPRKILLKSLTWEDDVYPDVGNEPQKIINEQILNDADILVAIFSTRIGSPTKDHESGSVEEIKEHYKSGKPLMIFFSTQDIPREQIDFQQIQKLTEFKKWCQENSVYYEYDNSSKFSNLLLDKLSLLMNNHKYVLDNTHVDEPETINHKVNLSDESRNILQEMSKDSHGYLHVGSTYGGYFAETNGNDFGSENHDPRIIAKIESIINELENAGLINPTTSKRDIFKITNDGYKYFEET